MKMMGKNMSVGVIVIIVIILVVMFSLGYLIFKSKGVDLENKKTLAKIMNTVWISDGKEKVEEIYLRHKTNSLKLEKLSDKSENIWLIKTRHQFATIGWVLWIEFKNDKVVSLKIRLVDNKDMKPENAPWDKIKQGRAPVPVGIQILPE